MPPALTYRLTTTEPPGKPFFLHFFNGFLRVPREAEENAEVRGQVQTSGGGETAQKPVLPGMGLIQFLKVFVVLGSEKSCL